MVSADAKTGDGVDVVVDLSKPMLPAALVDDPFDVVICSNVLQHVPDAVDAMSKVVRCVRPGGLMAVTAPRRYPWTRDPIDNGFRPSAMQLVALAGRFAEVECLSAEELSIANPRYYDFRNQRVLDSVLLRATRMRWRGRVPALRWRVSCALLRLAAAGVAT
jgi:SAM-dependent methyltransferase